MELGRLVVNVVVLSYGTHVGQRSSGSSHSAYVSWKPNPREVRQRTAARCSKQNIQQVKLPPGGETQHLITNKYTYLIDDQSALTQNGISYLIH